MLKLGLSDYWCLKAGSASVASASPRSTCRASGCGTSHFETLIPWLALCNARSRRAGEGIGHAVHEGDDSLMSLQDFRLRSSGAFFLGHPGVEDCAPDPAGISSITTRTWATVNN
jgi:hypothetical protein